MEEKTGGPYLLNYPNVSSRVHSFGCGQLENSHPKPLREGRRRSDFSHLRKRCVIMTVIFDKTFTL
jgi:hypothetical protein